MERPNVAEGASPRSEASNPVASRSSGTKRVPSRRPSPSSGRRIQVEEKKELMIERLLFEDDRKTNEFLKTLISANGLKLGWDDLQKRVQSCEDLCVEMVRKTSPSALQEEFVTRGEYTDKVEGQHSDDLKNHQERLQRREADSERQHMLNEDHSLRIHDHRGRLTAQEQAWDSVKRELSRIEVQDMQRHEDVLDMHGRAVADHTKRMDDLQEQISSLGTRMTNEENLRAALADEVAVLKEFLFGEQLTDHVKKVLRGILHEYSRKDELHAEAQAAVSIILKPVLNDHQRLKTEVANTNLNNQERYETIEDSLKKAHYKINEDARDFSLRMEDVNIRVDLCASKKSLMEKETAILNKVTNNSEYMKEIKKVTGLKFEELVNRMLEFQNIIEDHEHALQHQAEEMLNRTTKYDLMLCERRIDDCALREKVDADISELRGMTQWQSVKLEKLGVHQSFGGRRKAFLVGGAPGAGSKQSAGEGPSGGDGGASEAEAGASASKEDSQQAEDSLQETSRVSSPYHASRFHDTRFDQGMSPTELIGLLREQLERLAQGVLGVSHMVFHGVSQPVSTREERQLREAEMMHHLSCIVDWVAHKKAPADWDKVKFTSLVMSTSVPKDTERRRSPLHAVRRSPGASLSTAAPSQSSVASSVMAQVSPSLSSPSRSPTRRTRGGSYRAAPPDEESPEERSTQASRLGTPRTTSGASRPSTVRTSTSREHQEASSVVYAQSVRPTGGPSASPRMGGGFRGRLSKTRISVASGGHTEESRESVVHSEVLPRLVAALETEEGEATPSASSRE